MMQIWLFRKLVWCSMVMFTLGLLGQEDTTDADDPEATDELLAGHSAHGEAFNEGPRQSAYIMHSTGNVHFPISTQNPEVQAFFDQGVGQLHGFWYLEAERSFRHAAAIEPDCGMTYWGMAMANINNHERAKDFTQEAVNRKESVSEREQLWIETLEHYYLVEEGKEQKSDKDRSRQWVRDLETIVHEYPDEVEAKAFLAVRIWMNGRKGWPISSQQAVDSLLHQVFAVNPMHPAHHYRIHLWDREKPERALASAARGGQSARGIAHMWHMPGHIYSRLHRYADAAWQQEASARVDHAHMMRDRLLPDQIHNFAHNNEWLIRNLNHLGRVHDAVDLAKNMIELPRHPAYNHIDKRGTSSSYGRQRLVETLVRYELWDELIQLSDTVYLEASDVIDDEVRRLAACALAYYHRGDADNLQAQHDALSAILERAKKERYEAADEAEEKAREEEKSSNDITDEMAKALRGASGRIGRIRSAIAEAEVYIAMLEERWESAKEHLEEATSIPKERISGIYMALEDSEKAIEAAQDAKENSPNQVQVIANYIELMHQAGHMDKATTAFEELRAASGFIDPDMPIFKRLTELTADLGIPTEWKLDYEIPDDVGQRPELATLGPFRWQPSAALSWRLPKAGGGYLSLEDYKGKVLLLVFYLGYGCAHCVEQLTVINPELEAFADLGIELVAISTETLEELDASLSRSKLLGDIGFPLASNAPMDVFKQYRAFDDFEDMPLHGTFLIDEDGLVRWQDISYEPFTDVDFILNESKRLLAQPKPVTLAGGR